jgi:hypothetical protein
LFKGTADQRYHRILQRTTKMISIAVALKRANRSVCWKVFDHQVLALAAACSEPQWRAQSNWRITRFAEFARLIFVAALNACHQT